MTRPADIAAAIERWETFKAQWPHSKPGENAFDIGDEMARLLREREANASNSSNSSPGPVPEEVRAWLNGYVVDMASDNPRAKLDAGLVAYFASVYGGPEERALDHAPVSGEDEALLTHWHDDIVPHASAISSPIVKAGNALAARLRAALADLGRVRAIHLDLYRENERLRKIEAQSMEDWMALRGELTEARAARAAAVAEEREALLDDARSVLTNSANYTSGFDPVLKMARAYYSSRDRARAGRDQ